MALLTLVNTDISDEPLLSSGTPVTFYLKENWGDDWVAARTFLDSFFGMNNDAGDLFLQSASWSSDGVFSRASIIHRYGKRIGASAFEYTRPFSPLRILVKIHIGIPRPWQPSPLLPSGVLVPSYSTWVGQIDSESFRPFGSDGKVEHTSEIHQSGFQIFDAYGMEYLFHQMFIHSSWYVLNNQVRHCERGVVFNEDGLPNRTAGRLFGNHYFARQNDAVYWSTRNIVEYLLKMWNPIGLVYKEDLASMNRLPDFDSPVIHQHGMRVLEVLEELVSSRRFYTWWIEYDEVGNFSDTVFNLLPEVYSFRVQTYNVEPVTVQTQPFGSGFGGGFGSSTEPGFGVGFGSGFGGSASTIPANDWVLDVDADLDSSVTIDVKFDGTNKVDQVIVQGARRINCFTLEFTGNDKKGTEYWDSADATTYTTGAPAGAHGVNETRRRDAGFRERERFEDIYSRFGIDLDYALDSSLTKGLPPDDLKYNVSPFALNLLPTLPLYEGRDYSGNNIALGTVTLTGTRSTSYRPLYVVFELPNDRHIAANKVGNIERDPVVSQTDPVLNWTTTVDVVAGDPSFRITVQGQPQYIIARGVFIGKASDRPAGGDVDYRKMKATVAIEDDRFCEFRFPLSFVRNPWDFNGDFIVSVVPSRVLMINAGEEYRLDYVSNGTVVDVDEDGGLEKTTSGGFVRNDTAALSYIGRAAWQFYGVDRAAMQLTANYRSPAAGLHRGVLITRIRHGTAFPGTVLWVNLNSVITSVMVSFPWSESNQPGQVAGRPEMTITTATGELDLSLFGPNVRSRIEEN